MRTTISIILSVIMLLSACCFTLPVSAVPEGTPINTADEFMAMTADGTYYLNADITLAASYEAPFSGTLDGNCTTVTISAPMFLEFIGTAKNFTLNGSINAESDAGSLTVTSTAGMVVENVTTNVDINVVGTGKHAGGIFATNYGMDVTSTYTNVVNNGNIYVDTAEDKPRAGGMGGIGENSIFTNCVNNGDVYVKGTTICAAGLLARPALHASLNTAEAYFCVNNGNITSEDLNTDSSAANSDAAGIFGYTGAKGNIGFYRIYGCLNTGDISGQRYTAGLCSYVYGQASQFIDIQFSVNTGNITYGRTGASNATSNAFASDFIAYTNTTSTIICYNIGMGTIKKAEGTLCTNPVALVSCSTADASLYTVMDNYIVDTEAYLNYSYTATAENAHNVLPISYAIENGCATFTTADELKSGKICVALNNAGQGGEDSKYWFYQTLGTDDIPTISSDSQWVLDNNGTFVNGEKPEVAVTTPVETTTAAPKETEAPKDTETEAPDTTTAEPVADTTTAAAPTTEAPTTEAPKAEGGCGGFVALGIVACMIPAAVIICSKKKED